jgi:DNA repair photolyase
MSKSTFTINTSAVLTNAQSKALYKWTMTWRNGKPVFLIPTRGVISEGSEFQQKKLCDGLTFTLDLTCGFSCLFCYVPSILCRHAAIARIMKETGLGFQDIVVEKEDPLPILRRELTMRDGRLKYADPSDSRVIFASPLVDVAANSQAVRRTIDACRIILVNTHWTIRLLSKSAALRQVAEGLADYRERVIYGLSTGTLSDAVARAFEAGASSPTARIRTLRWLQDNGYRTYGMACPCLPQEDYAGFAAQVAEAIRADQCEQVWAEALNVRGQSLVRTCKGLRAAGFERESNLVEAVRRDPAAWEANARATLLALAKVIPREKLSFLQYVGAGQRSWWEDQRHLGAVLLGKELPPRADAPIAE